MQLNYKKYAVDPENFQTIRLIDKGGFGIVNEVRDKSTGKKLAAKVIISDKNDFKSKQAINREILIMIRCQHPTIINFYGFSIEDLDEKTKVTVFMEFAEKNSLLNILKKVKSGTAEHAYDNTIKQIILIGIAGGMMHLHRHNIIHCDLKPANVLIDSLFHPHLTDFGLSQIFKNDSKILNSNSSEFGTIVYMAPEVIECRIYNIKIDVYSFGIMMYEIVTDSIPYPDLESGVITLFKFQNKIVNDNYRPKFDIPVKKSIKNLIEKCWSKEPENRPSFEEIFNQLAYNFSESIFEQKDENDFYLDDVDVDEVISNADSIQFFDNSGQLDQVLKKFQALEKSITPLMKENEAIKKENLKMKNDFAALQEANKKLLNENNTIKTLLKKIMTHEINPLKKENDELINENKAIKAQLKKVVDDEIDQIKEANDELAKENKAIKAQLKKVLDNEINPLKVENENLKKQLDIISKKLDENITRTVILAKKEDKTEPFIDINKITINKFNSLELNVQKNCFSQILSTKTTKLFVVLNNLLQFILKFAPAKALSYFKISTNDNNKDELLCNINENHTICLLCNSIILLFENRQLDYSSEFFDILKQIKTVSLEIKYPYKHFEALFTIVSTFKMIHKIEISVIITDNNKFDSPFQNSKNIKSVRLDISVSQIKENTFNGSSLEEIIIPESVMSIGPKSFYQCSSLKKIRIPFSIAEICSETFYGCSSLVEVEIPMSVNSIGDSAFFECSSLKEIKIPQSVKTIGKSAFSGCSSLTKIEIPPSVQSIGSDCFEGVTTLEISGSIPENTFYECSSITEIIISQSVQKIGNSAFYECSSLKTIVIPSSVKTGADCFNYNWGILPTGNKKKVETKVKCLQIFGNIEHIPDNFFCSSSYEEIIIPSTIKTIGKEAFKDCYNLNKMTIPISVISIGDDCFCNCNNLQSIKFESLSFQLGKDTFISCYKLHDIQLSSYRVSCEDRRNNNSLFNGIQMDISTFNSLPGEIQNNICYIVQSINTSGMDSFYKYRKFIISILSYISNSINNVKNTFSYINFSDSNNKIVYVKSQVISILFSNKKQNFQSFLSIVRNKYVVLEIERSLNNFDSILSSINNYNNKIQNSTKIQFKIIESD